MSLNINNTRDRLINKQNQLSCIDAYAKISWEIEGFLVVYSSKKRNKLNNEKWQNRYIKKSLKLLLNLEKIVASIDVLVLRNQQVLDILKKIKDFNYSNDIDIFQITNLLGMYYILLPYLYVDVTTIYEILKNVDKVISVSELRPMVLVRYLPKILNVGPNIYKTWKYLKRNDTVYNDFEKEFDNIMNLFIFNYLTPEEVNKVITH